MLTYGNTPAAGDLPVDLPAIPGGLHGLQAVIAGLRVGLPDGLFRPPFHLVVAGSQHLRCTTAFKGYRRCLIRFLGSARVFRFRFMTCLL
jgi:hypothetical protein